MHILLENSDAMADMGKHLQLCVILLQGFNNGLFLEYLGPSLPDLQCQMGVDEASIKILLLLTGLGSLIFMFLLPIFEKHLSANFITALCSSIVCIGFITIPLTTNIYLASLLVFFIAGASELGLAVQLHIAMTIGDGRIIHIVYIAAAVGYIAGPLVLSPFLSDGSVTVWYKEMIAEQQLSRNVSIDNSVHHQTSEETIDKSFLMCSDDFTTLILFPYILFGCFSLLVSLGSVYLLLNGYSKRIVEGYEIFDTKILEKNRERVFRTITFLLFTSIWGLYNTFDSLIPTFGISSMFHLGPSKMSLIATFCSVAKLIGRGVALCASSAVSQRFIIIQSLIGITLAMICLSVTPLVGETLIWITSALFGFFVAPLPAAALLHSADTIPSNSRLNTWYMICSVCGLLHPYICGFFMAQFGAVAFIYYMSLLSFSVYLSILALSVFRDIISENQAK